MNKILLLILLSCISLGLWADDPLTLAREYEAAGKIDKAVSQYILWLDGHFADTEYIEILVHTAEIIPSLSESISFLEARTKLLDRKKRSYEVYDLLAGLYEVKGDIKNALANLKQAIRMSPGDEQVYFKLKYTALLIETGEHNLARDMAVSVLTGSSSSGVQLEATLLILRIQILKKNKEEIETIIGNIVSAIPADELSPAFYLMAYMGYLISGDTDKAWEMKRDLKVLYPESPEWYLCSRDIVKVGWTHLPSHYLVPIDGRLTVVDTGEDTVNPVSTPVVNTTPGVQATATPDSRDRVESHFPGYFIQIGAYSDFDNAQHQMKGVTDAGFEGIIYETGTTARTLYKVLVPVGAASQKGVVLQKLKAKGFGGFPVFVE